MRGQALPFRVREPGAGEIRPVRLRHAAEERHVTKSGWSATADQVSRVIAEAV